MRNILNALRTYFIHEPESRYLWRQEEYLKQMNPTLRTRERSLTASRTSRSTERCDSGVNLDQVWLERATMYTGLRMLYFVSQSESLLGSLRDCNSSNLHILVDIQAFQFVLAKNHD